MEKATLFRSNLGHITDYALTFFPDRPALLQDDLELSYRELDARINQVAQGLLGAGLRRGERVLILWQNDLRFIEVVLGAIRAGGVAVPVNSTLSVDSHRDILDDCGARHLLASDGPAASVRALVDGGLVETAVQVDGDGDAVADYESWLSAQSSDRPDVEVDVDEAAWQAYTSGSTGKPKGVLIPHRMLLRDARLVSQAMFVEPSDRVIVSTPLFHMNASGVGLLPALASGASAYVLPGFDPERVLSGIERYSCTYITGVPAMYKLLLAHHAAGGQRDLSSLRTILCGSAPMPPTLLDKLLEVFPSATFSEGYGLTEVGPVATLVPKMGLRKLGSIGLPFPGFEIRVVGPAGEDLPAGETGELWLRTECMTLGYHHRPTEDERRFRDDGWFATADLVMVDEDGWLYFRGRADDRMNVGGENVYPAEVEGILIQHPSVRDASVVAQEHETKGEAPVAYVVLEAGADLAEEELKAFFLERGPAYAHPRQIVFLNALPLSGTGKVDRKSLQRHAAGERV